MLEKLILLQHISLGLVAQSNLRKLIGRLGKPVYIKECHPTIKLDDFTYITVLPAIIIILIASILQRRKTQNFGNYCNNRPGVPVPVNLLDEYEDRFAYAAAFGSTATNCLTLLSYHFFPSHSPESTRVLYAMLSVTIMGIDYYPFFTCISHKESLIWSLVGTVYSSIWFAVNLMSAVECEDKSAWLIPAQPIIIQLPVLSCLAYLVCIFLVRVLDTGRKFFANNTSERCCTWETDKQILMKKHHILHVELLMKKVQRKERSLKWIVTLKQWLRSMTGYEKDTTFRYSSRMVSTVVVAVLCLYEFSLMAFINVEKGMRVLRQFLTTDESEYDGVRFVYSPGFLGQVSLFLDVLHISWYISFSVSLLGMVTYLVNICVSYRCQYKCLLRGDYSFIPQQCMEMSNTDFVSNSLMYSGLQIAFIFWAFGLMTLTLILCDLVVAYFLVLPSMGLVSDSLLDPLWDLLPTIVISYTVYYLQVIISKVVLLQTGSPEKGLNDRLGEYLAINNRRIYHNVSYFLFFYYILLGLFRSFLRVLLGIVHGVVYLGRLDRSGLVQGFEHWDRGYLSYVSLLRVEVTHCHPVLVTFCHLLTVEVKCQPRMSSKSICAICQRGTKSPTTPRARLKWFLMYTLIKNKSLTKYRKTHMCFTKKEDILITICSK